jgi:hypothetical protein
MQEQREKTWITPDFEVKFREAMGREMTTQEREFFGIAPEKGAANATNAVPDFDRSQFAWQALRRISALIG